ncbi:hypothetical protein Tco_0000324 [Tanacetum coccineum]
MNPQEKQQVAARDDKWVPLSERVKISSTNIRLETTVPQKEETFQVVIDLIKNSTCFKAFTISADVPEIFMTILDICPRVEGVDFTDVPDDDTALTFLIDLGYKGPLYKHTNIKKTASRRVVKKKVTISAADNIIPDPGAALELAKSINQTKAEEAEAARKIYPCYTCYDHTPSAPKSKPVTSKTKLKGASSLTLKEQENADIMQTLKESKKTSKRQLGTEGSNEGTGSKPGFLMSPQSSLLPQVKETGIKPGFPIRKKDITEDKAILE